MYDGDVFIRTVILITVFVLISSVAYGMYRFLKK